MTWAITEPALRQMVLIATRQNDLAHWQAVRDQQMTPHNADDWSSTASMIKGIAVLPVQGPIFRHANLFTYFSGATSLDLLAKEFRTLVDDDTVEGILLEIDSPGGEAAGINEFADQIFAARGKKPIIAYADDLCASAGYWIASAADKIITAETAAIGSIGVIAAMHKPPTAEDEYVEFISAVSPYKRPLYQDDGPGRVQMMVDQMADIFVEKVARNRNVDASHVLSNFGEGWVKIGKDAVESGLADEVGTFTSVLNDMYALRGSSPSTTLPSTIDAKTAGLPVEIKVTGGTQAAVDSIEGFASRMSANIRDEITKLIPGANQTSVVEVQTATEELDNELISDGGAPMDTGVEGTEEETVENPTVVDSQAPVSATPVASAPDANSNDAQRVRALEQQIERMHMERHSTDATAFADVQIAERRAFPAERESLIAAYTQAAMDDLRIGGSTSRVELIKAVYAARPQHQLTMEQLAPALAEVLNRGDRSTMTHDDDRPLDTKQVEELIGKTNTGRAALAAARNGHSG